MDGFLHFSETWLQYIALLCMAVVYILRLRWYFGFVAGKERQAPTAARDANQKQAIIYSWANIAMPWAMESTRTKFFLYLQFALFHIGVAAAIGLSFIIPELPPLLESAAFVVILQILCGAACLIGILRLIRRVGSKHMRAISSPDDYFSLCLLTAWFFFAVMAAPGNPTDANQGAPYWALLTFFLMTAFFLFYVPFSKISHYLYYPFTRYYFGKSMGRRGVYPIHRVPSSNSAV